MHSCKLLIYRYSDGINNAATQIKMKKWNHIWKIRHVLLLLVVANSASHPPPCGIPSALTRSLPQWIWAEAPGRMWAAGLLLLSEIHVSWSPHGLNDLGYEDPPDSSGNPTRIPFRKLTEKHSVSVVAEGRARGRVPGSQACLQTDGKCESQRGHSPVLQLEL